MIFDLSEPSEHSDDYIFGKPEKTKNSKRDHRKRKSMKATIERHLKAKPINIKYPKVRTKGGPSTVASHLEKRVEKFSKTRVQNRVSRPHTAFVSKDDAKKEAYVSGGVKQHKKRQKQRSKNSGYFSDEGKGKIVFYKYDLTTELEHVVLDKHSRTKKKNRLNKSASKDKKAAHKVDEIEDDGILIVKIGKKGNEYVKPGYKK
jgi:hypothetical protein